MSYLDLSVRALKQGAVAQLACLKGLRALGLEATGNQPAQVGLRLGGGRHMTRVLLHGQKQPATSR